MFYREINRTYRFTQGVKNATPSIAYMDVGKGDLSGTKSLARISSRLAAWPAWMQVRSESRTRQALLLLVGNDHTASSCLASQLEIRTLNDVQLRILG